MQERTDRMVVVGAIITQEGVVIAKMPPAEKPQHKVCTVVSREIKNEK
jgi:hypothetical protein